MSLIGVDVGRMKQLHYVTTNGKNRFMINLNERINLFDGSIEVTIEDEVDMTLTEGFERLSELFDNISDRDNRSVVSPIDGLLKHGTDGNGNRPFIIDPKNHQQTSCCLFQFRC